MLTALGAFIVCFRKPIDEAALEEIKSLLKNVSAVVKDGCGYMWDGACLAVAMPQSTTPFLEKSFEDWEDICQDFGFEFVDAENKGRNQYSGKPVSLLSRFRGERLRDSYLQNLWVLRD